MTDLPLDQVVCGDSLTIMRAWPDASIDLVCSSPPYNVRVNYGTGVDDNRPWPEYYAWLREVMTECQRLLVVGGILALNLPKEVKLPHEQIEALGRRVEKISTRAEIIAEEIGLLPRESIVWIKGRDEASVITATYRMGSDNNLYMRSTCELILLFSKGQYWRAGLTGRRGKVDVPFLDETKDLWFIPPVHRNNHPASFPLEIPHRLVRMFAVRPKGEKPVVLDPFCGSGTTLVAAKELGCRYIGIDLVPRFCEMARNQLSQLQMFQNEMKDDDDEDYELCSCEFCPCTLEVRGGGICSDCLAGAHRA